MNAVKPILLTLFLMMLSQACIADTTLGRLFSTPSQRNDLEQLRQVKKTMPTAVETSVQEVSIQAPKPLPEAINLQGYVKRSDGKEGTVWVNGQALQENSGNKEVTVGKLPTVGNRVPIKIPANGKQITLKAGQVYDPDSNRVHEASNHAAQGDAGTIDDAAEVK